MKRRKKNETAKSNVAQMVIEHSFNIHSDSGGGEESSKWLVVILSDNEHDFEGV